ncbi:MAG: hypothetical protein Q8J64_03855 [Thermodesulfovibrionales bacterium]|nr:hypothetical protein [Thermodesulfovibrionales bacterium]
MKGIVKKLGDIFSAVAFAEEGEHETAREIMRGVEPEKKAESPEPLGVGGFLAEEN